MPTAALTQPAFMAASHPEQVAPARKAILTALDTQPTWEPTVLIEHVASITGIHKDIVEFATFELRAEQIIAHNHDGLLGKK